MGYFIIAGACAHWALVYPDGQSNIPFVNALKICTVLYVVMFITSVIMCNYLDTKYTMLTKFTVGTIVKNFFVVIWCVGTNMSLFTTRGDYGVLFIINNICFLYSWAEMLMVYGVVNVIKDDLWQKYSRLSDSLTKSEQPQQPQQIVSPIAAMVSYNDVQQMFVK